MSEDNIFSIFIARPKDARKKSKKIKEELRESIEKSVVDLGIHLLPRDCDTLIDGIHLAFQEEVLDSAIREASLIVIIIESERGRNGFSHELDLIKELISQGKPVIGFVPNSSCEGRTLVIERLGEVLQFFEYEESNENESFTTKCLVEIPRAVRKVRLDKEKKFRESIESLPQSSENNNSEKLEQNKKIISKISSYLEETLWLFEVILFLLSPLDLKNESLRSRIRNFLNITLEKEKVLLDELIKQKILIQKGELIFFKDEKLGREKINFLVKQKKLSLEEITNQILNGN